MNTIAHLVFNLVTVEQGRVCYAWPPFMGMDRDRARLPIIPTVWGSLIPDLPMVVFYAVEKLLRGQSEQYIWGTAYFLPHWTQFIALFNSLPLIGLGFLLCFWRKNRWGWLCFSGMFLHVLGDLPLHHDDGHHHFLPLSHWRFESPVSYWDPDHFGGVVSVIEAIAVLIACLYLFQAYQSRWGKGIIGVFIVLDTVMLVVLTAQLF